MITCRIYVRRLVVCCLCEDAHAPIEVKFDAFGNPDGPITLPSVLEKKHTWEEEIWFGEHNGNTLCWYGLLEFICEGADPAKKLVRNWHYTPGPGAPTNASRRSCDRELDPSTQSKRAKIFLSDREFLQGRRLGPVSSTNQNDTGESRTGNNTWARKSFIGVSKR